MSTRHLKRTLTFSVTSALLLSAACSGGELRDEEKPVGQPESQERTDHLLPEEHAMQPPILNPAPTPPVDPPAPNIAPILPSEPGQRQGEGEGSGEEKKEGGAAELPKLPLRPQPPKPDEGVTVNPGPNEL